MRESLEVGSDRGRTVAREERKEKTTTWRRGRRQTSGAAEQGATVQELVLSREGNAEGRCNNGGSATVLSRQASAIEVVAWTCQWWHQRAMEATTMVGETMMKGATKQKKMEGRRKRACNEVEK